MYQNHLLTAGEFAGLAGTTKHTLFHYDEIGLFCPISRSEKGYRFYSIEQLDTFDVIATLRELDMPLFQIREYLETRNPEAFLTLLAKEEALITERIAALKQTRSWIRAKSLQTASFLSKPPKKVEVLSFPPQYCVCADISGIDDQKAALRISELYKLSKKNGYKSPYNIGFIQDEALLTKGIFSEYSKAYLLFDQPPVRLSHRLRPSGPYLCACHTGHWKEIGETYRRLFEYADAHSLTLDKSFFEDYLLDELTMKDPKTYVTRISARILHPAPL